MSNESSRRIVQQLLNDSNFYFRVPLGSVRLHHSRESLEYNKATQKEICAILYKVSQDIQIAKEKLADSEDLWEAKKNYAQVINALPYQVRGVFSRIVSSGMASRLMILHFKEIINCKKI